MVRSDTSVRDHFKIDISSNQYLWSKYIIEEDYFIVRFRNNQERMIVSLTINIQRVSFKFRKP